MVQKDPTQGCFRMVQDGAHSRQSHSPCQDYPGGGATWVQCCDTTIPSLWHYDVLTCSSVMYLAISELLASHPMVDNA